MKKFIVKIDNMCSSLLEIEAESKEQAREKAKDFFENNKQAVLNLKDYHTSTTPPDMWPIIDKIEFEDLQKQLDKQSKIKERAALLIRRADIIDHRSKIRNTKSLVGTIEEYLLTKELIDVEKEVDAKQITLDDTTRKEIDRMINDDFYGRNTLLKYMDPEARPWKIADLIEAKQKCEIRMVSNNTNVNFIEDRDRFDDMEVLEMAKRAQEKAALGPKNIKKQIEDSQITESE